MVNYCVVFTRQMRTLFCKRLAACLCMKQPTTAASVEFAVTNSFDVANSNKEDDYFSTSFTETTADETTTNRLLKRMCDLLETLVHREGQRCEDDKENEMKKDWMLAAAVLDRICAIAITVVFVAGTVVIFAVCFMHP